MLEEFLQSVSSSAGICLPSCVKASSEQEDYDASQSAALIAVSLISCARVSFKLDTEDTHYSAQYLVDNAGKEEVQGEMDQERCQFTAENIFQYLVETFGSKKEDEQGEEDERRCDLTVKDCLEFAFKKGLPREEHWSHLGCKSKAPPFACQIPRVPMKGEVIEAKNFEEALKLLDHQPVGARLHVFSPEFDRVGEGIYDGPSGNGTHYVGLRDVIIVDAEKMEGKVVATVKMSYKKKITLVKVSVRRVFLPVNGDDESQVTEATDLLVDFCIPRLSIN